MRPSLEIFNREFALEISKEAVFFTLGKREFALLLNQWEQNNSLVSRIDTVNGFNNREILFRRHSLIVSSPA